MTLPRRTFAVSAALSPVWLAACSGEAPTPSGPTSAGPATSGPASPSPSASTPDAPGSAVGAYTAGTYDAEGSYTNPGGTSSVAVSLTLDAAGTVSAVEVTPKGTGTSLQFQRQFAGGVSAEVVGKKIDEIAVDKVSGSSLTSGGFKQALEQIKTKAKA